MSKKKYFVARAGIGTADLTTPPLCKKTHKVQVDSLQMATSLENNSHAHEKRVTSAQVIKTGSDKQFSIMLKVA